MTLYVPLMNINMTVSTAISTLEHVMAGGHRPGASQMTVAEAKVYWDSSQAAQRCWLAWEDFDRADVTA